MPNNDPYRPWAAAATGTETCASRSLHTDGVNVVLANGSSRFVSDNIDLTVWRALLSIASRDVVSDY